LKINFWIDWCQLLIEKKEKSSKEYFDRLINVNGSTDVSNGLMIEENHELSPIEVIFHKYMKKSLIGYQDYYKTLELGMEDRKRAIGEKYSKKMVNYKKKNDINGNVEDDPKIIKYTNRCQDEIQALEETFQKSTELLINSYEEYLSEIDPSPQFLPVHVTIKIPEKDIEIKNVRIDRTFTAGDLKTIVSEHMEKIGNPITEYANTNIFVLFKSFSSTTDSNRNRNDGVLLTDDSVPVLQYNPQPGALILLKGNLMCRSDQPKQCFKSTFKPGDKMDYFSCTDCKLKWLCRPCMEDCHKGHQVQLYILDHNATWACCYCYKSKKCGIYKDN